MPSDSPGTVVAATPKFADRLPPHVFFLVSAVFHYLGPSFAVLLFSSLAPPGGCVSPALG
jgi:threonine/homoserine efflux transporter RhtA